MQRGHDSIVGAGALSLRTVEKAQQSMEDMDSRLSIDNSAVDAESLKLVEEAAAEFPGLAEKWTRYINTVNKLPAEAFSSEQRPWLAKLFHDHTQCSSLALQISDGCVNSRGEMFEALAREMQMELADERASPWSSEGSAT